MRHDPTAFAVARSARIGVRSSHLIAAIVGLLGLDNLLTLSFLGLDRRWTWGIGLVVLGLICGTVARLDPSAFIPWRRLAACFAIGIFLVLLGGEGHLVYANYDWIIRDAVLSDMMRAPWPFAYVGHGDPMLLRAPIGMYLLPTLAGKIGGWPAIDIVLPLQNGLLLGTLLALGSLLFETARARRIALAVVVCFGGLDTLGALVIDATQLVPLTAHIEGWATQTTYCSQIVSLFWAPQHALAGWTGTLLFLLWRAGRAPLAALLTIVPLTLIWSPLATVGVLPFVALAGFETLGRRRLVRADILLPALAVALAAIPILYVHAGSGAVGLGVNRMTPPIYALFVLLEAGVWLAAIWLGARGGRFGKSVFAICAVVMLGACLVQVGAGADFAMRTTLAPITIMAVLIADLLGGAAPRRAMPWLLLALGIAAMTPLREAGRALLFRPTPALRCDFWATWDASFPAWPKSTYVTRWDDLPALIGSAPRSDLQPMTAAHCWDGYWKTPRGG